VHPEGLWQISYPTGWDVEGPAFTYEGQERVLFTQTLPEYILLGFGVLDVWRYVGHSQTNELVSWSLSVLESVQSVSDSYQLLSWEQANLGGYPAYESVWISGSLESIDMHLFIGNDGYRIRGVADPERWGNDKELLRQLVYSFRPLASAIPRPTPTPTSMPLPLCSPTIPVAVFQGAGPKNTEVFTVSCSPWTLEWETFGGCCDALFIVLANPDTGRGVDNPVATVVEEPTKTVTLVYGQTGTFYLEVDGPPASNGGWRITIHDGQ